MSSLREMEKENKIITSVLCLEDLKEVKHIHC